MKDIPIIFSALMVRALLDGRKTMTRRLLRQPVPEPPAMDAVHPANVAKHAVPYLDAYCSARSSAENPRGMGRNWCWWTRDDRACEQFKVGFVPGDRLWVREAVAYIDNEEFNKPSYWQYRADTDGKCFAGEWPEEERDNPDRPRWKPAIHMPRVTSRLTLIVSAVKIERVQDITNADAVAEGIPCTEIGIDTPDPLHRAQFADLWEKLHGAGAWDVNPYVVAITFTVHKTNIDALPKVEAA